MKGRYGEDLLPDIRCRGYWCTQMGLMDVSLPRPSFRPVVFGHPKSPLRGNGGKVRTSWMVLV